MSLSKEQRNPATVAAQRINWLVLILALAFCAAISTLSILKHNSLHTRALDLAKFDQAIWNTLHGRFLFSSLQNFSILGNHFSPFLALLAPIFWIWNDVRALLVLQAMGLALTGVFLSWIVRTRHPKLAIGFLLAFYLNPALHEIALVEFRRVTVAMPFLALALYALSANKRWLTAIALVAALLCKESIGLVVAVIGLYLLIFRRDWRWGLPVFAVGIAWAVVVTLWVIPIFNESESAGGLYPQLNYFGLSGDSYVDIAADLARSSWSLVQRIFDREGTAALLRTFLPLGLVLPFVAADWAFIALPYLFLMLMSLAPSMHRLESWYLASVLPGLFAAVAVGLGRVPDRWRKWALLLLLCSAALGYALYSPAPLGARYDAALYRAGPHESLAHEAIDEVPGDARIAAQDPYVPHLSHREHIYLYPWISGGLESVDYVLLDRNAHPYPMQPHEMSAAIDDLIADTSYVIRWEADGIYLFHRNGEPLPAIDVRETVDRTMLLERIDIAVQDGDGRFQPVNESIEASPGQQVRVSLYWKALADPVAERTVSVRIRDQNGALAAVHDNQPGQGKKPTSWWKEGWQIRDVYYLEIAPHAPPGQAMLDVLLYDSYTQEPVPFEGGREQIQIAQIEIVPQ